MAERIFRVFSLAFLSIGFLVAVAGADKDGAQDLANATTDLIQHVSAATEANSVNGTPASQSNKGISLTSETNYVAKADTDTITAESNQPSQKPVAQTLPHPSN